MSIVHSDTGPFATQRSLQKSIGPKLGPIPRNDLVPPNCVDHFGDPNMILDAAKQSATKAEFMQRIGSRLRAFTFQTETQNDELKSAISAEFPGTIQASLDGRVVMRQVCDPLSTLSNQVDLYIKTEKPPYILTYRIRFDGRKTSPTKITPPDQTNCMGCHSTVDYKKSYNHQFIPIWQEYRTWKGFLGSDDDTLNSSEAHILTGIRRKARSGNPCYANLPWPRAGEKVEDPKSFPYRTRPGQVEHALNQRANLLMTEILSKQTNQISVAREFEADPRRTELVAVLMTMEMAADGQPRRLCSWEKEKHLWSKERQDGYHHYLDQFGIVPLTAPGASAKTFNDGSGSNASFAAALLEKFIEKKGRGPWHTVKSSGLVHLDPHGHMAQGPGGYDRYFGNSVCLGSDRIFDGSKVRDKAALCSALVKRADELYGQLGEWQATGKAHGSMKKLKAHGIR